MTIDPYFERERERYTNPIASREHILAVIKRMGKPQSVSQLKKQLTIDDSQQQIALEKRLRAMELEGQLLRNRRGAFGLVSNTDLRVGLVRGNKDGSGVCVLENGEKAMYLSTLQMLRVFDGDRVMVSPRIRFPEGDQECVITDIIERNTNTLIGYFFHGRDVGFVEPRNKRICHRVMVKQYPQELEKGTLVEVKVTQQPGRHQQPEGKIVRVINPYETSLDEVQIALLTHNLPTLWSNQVLEEVAALDDLQQGQDYPDREDIRDLALVTIDGADSRDFDDAVYCEKLPGGTGFRALVAVADVSHYVDIDSELDRCAQQRGSSVYFPREVIPMLPERLSNDLCSLNPQMDRLVVVCEIILSRSGKCKDFHVFQAVMRSHARLTYDQVNNHLAGTSRLEDSVSPLVVQNLANITECFRKLEQCREKRGALSFELPEYVFTFATKEEQSRKHTATKASHITGIVPRYRGTAHKLIEEFMVLANTCVARLCTVHNIPTLYRVHAAPDAQKVEKFRHFVQGVIGTKLAGGSAPKPRDFARVVKETTGHPLAEYLFPMVLRTMQQAVYTPVNQGHYGLALQYYCHFTSPIRRYPDLLVHRGIKALLATSRKSTHVKSLGKRAAGAKFVDLYPYSIEQMQVLGLQVSMSEHRATEASYDVFAYLSCTYLSQFVGETMHGIIKSITSFGLFVSIGDTNIDGLVHISTLHGDYYHFDANSISLVGERTHRRFSLGDRLRVRIASVNVAQGRIDLLLEGAEQEKGIPSKKKTSRNTAAGVARKGKKTRSIRSVRH